MNDFIFVALSSFAAEDSRPLDLLKSSGYPFRIHETGKRITSPELLRDAREATVILAGVEQYDAEILAQLSSLKCISRLGTGVDAIDLSAARARGITVSNTPGIPTTAVAELALAMILTLIRNLHWQANLMHARRWERVAAHLLDDRTVGLIGFGSIGQRVAQLCRAFNARVVSCDPIANQDAASRLGVSLVSKEALLREADIVSIHASRSADQRPVIGTVEFESMKSGAVLVNLARGDMVDEAALVDALKSGKLSGAGLDVFSTEPYSGPLCDFEQVILTPHSATNTVETRTAMEMKCVENALGFLQGKLPSACRVL